MKLYYNNKYYKVHFEEKNKINIFYKHFQKQKRTKSSYVIENENNDLILAFVLTKIKDYKTFKGTVFIDKNEKFNFITISHELIHVALNFMKDENINNFEKIDNEEKFAELHSNLMEQYVYQLFK